VSGVEGLRGYRVRAERLGPAFDLLAGYGASGCFMERSGHGVAGVGRATSGFSMALAGPQAGIRRATLKELFGGYETGDGEAGAPPPLLFGSVPFDVHRAGTFFVPARTIRRDRDGETWAIDVAWDGAFEAQPPVGPSGAGAPSAPFSGMQLFPEPLPDAYERAVGVAVERIRSGHLQKVVLARTLRVEAERELDPHQLLRRLRAVEPAGYTFAMHLDEGRTLVGASPELLISRFGREVRANPLAGTAPRFGDPNEDRAAAEALGSSAKDRQEHAIVVEDVFRVLHPICDELHYDRDPQLLATANVWHLSTRFRGTLKRPVPDALGLVAALHPTPAVCGEPREEAMRLIRELEPVPRDAYAGAVGWMDANGDGVWALALRCAELRGDTARLYAGAGIVADSDPAAELDETERKFRAFLDALRWG
jgi:isochorismate synthase